MSQPTPYTPTIDFSQQEANNASGRSTVNTAALDTEFANIETTLDQTLANLQLIQRDDGKLKDVTVEIHTLSPEVLQLMGGFNLRGAWLANTDYAVNDLVSNTTYLYVCQTAHNSGPTFSDTNWHVFGFAGSNDAAAAAASAQVSANNAANSANSASNSAIAADASADSADASEAVCIAKASEALASANAADVSETNAANSANAAAASAASITLPIPVASGGTGATNMTDARTNLGLGSVAVLNSVATGNIDNNAITTAKIADNNVTDAKLASATLKGISAGTTMLSFRNKIINGDFRVNQRVYVSGATVGAGLYGHDRWKMAASGDTYTFSTTANKTTVTIPAGKVLQQVVEGLNLQTGTYTLSWEGTAQGKIGAGSYGASGITGSITGGTNTTIEFGPGTVANIQLEAGSIATPFEHRPIGTELALCQRYYEKSFLLATAPAQNAGLGTGEVYFRPNAAGATSQRNFVSFKVAKRATPSSVTLFNPAAANAQVRDVSVPGDCSATALITSSQNSFEIACTGNASTILANRLGYHWTAEAEL